jgi:hypothetical protein
MLKMRKTLMYIIFLGLLAGILCFTIFKTVQVSNTKRSKTKPFSCPQCLVDMNSELFVYDELHNRAVQSLNNKISIENALIIIVSCMNLGTLACSFMVALIAAKKGYIVTETLIQEKIDKLNKLNLKDKRKIITLTIISVFLSIGATRLSTYTERYAGKVNTIEAIIDKYETESNSIRSDEEELRKLNKRYEIALYKLREL